MRRSLRPEQTLPWPRLAGWILWLGLLVWTAVGGQAIARSVLAPATLGDPASWAAWAGARPPLEASFAVLGLLLVAFAWYLLAVSALAVGARLWGAGRLVSVIDILTLPVLRRSIHAALGLGLVGTSITGVAAGEGTGRPVALVATTVDNQAEEGEAPVMRLLPEEAAGRPDAVVSDPTTGAGEWEIRPGQHLWSVAVQVLAQAGVDADDEGAVVRYWLRLIEANTDRLADPDNPDLVYPGQLLTLPLPSPVSERALP